MDSLLTGTRRLFATLTVGSALVLTAGCSTQSQDLEFEASKVPIQNAQGFSGPSATRTGDPAVIEIELAQADGCGQHIVSASLEEPATLVLALEWDVPKSPVGLESCGYSLEVFRHSLTSAELIGEEIEEVQIVDATRTKLDPLPLG